MSDQVDRLKAALAHRYAIERELGAGGMATVFLAQDIRHERRVAVKVLKPELAAALGPDRFPREIKIVAQLQHPHILPLHDSGETDGFLYYVMPFVEGESLREKLRRDGELPILDAVRILREVVDALAHAHSHGIMHRDIKPDNIMLSGRHAQVMDFGVAKALSDSGGEKLTTVGVAVGTPMYMSPEQATGSEHVDARSDIYAVGVVAYEMLVGSPPFTGKNQQAILSSQVLDTPPDMIAERSSIPPGLASLVMRCLAKNPADRWQSAEEMIPQLENMSTASGGVTPTDTRPVQLTAPQKKLSARVWAGSTVVALAGVLGLGWFFVGADSVAGVDRIAVLPFTDASGQDEGFVDAMHNSLITSLSRLDGASVRTRASVMLYRDDRLPDAQIAAQLNIGAIVDAQVFRLGDRARLTVQFSEALTSRVLWAETYELTGDDVFAVQDSLVQLVTAEIRTALTVAESR